MLRGIMDGLQPVLDLIDRQPSALPSTRYPIDVQSRRGSGFSFTVLV